MRSNHSLIPQQDSIVAKVLILYFLPVVLWWFFAADSGEQSKAFYLFLGIGISSFLSLFFLIMIGKWQTEALAFQKSVNHSKKDSPYEKGLVELTQPEANSLIHPPSDQGDFSENDLAGSTHNPKFDVPQPEAHATAHAEACQKLQELIDQKEAQIKFLASENEGLHQENEGLHVQLKQSRLEIGQGLELKNKLQDEIHSKEAILKEKEALITKLNKQVAELQFELNMLLKIEKNSSNSEATKSQPPIVDSKSFELSRQSSFGLKSWEMGDFGGKKDIVSDSNNIDLSKFSPKEMLGRCLDIAAKLSEERHFGEQPSRFMKLSSDLLAIENRRLFDALRAEDFGAIFVFSQDEKKVVFASPKVQTLLGWSPAKFCRDFFALIDDEASFRSQVQVLHAQQNIEFPVSVRTKNGALIDLVCHVGSPPSSSTFSQQIIGVLSVSASALHS